MDRLEPLLRELIGHALRTERHAQKRTLADVAARGGVSMQHLSDVERGSKDASSEVLAAVLGALGLHVTDLAALLAPRPAMQRIDLTARPGSEGWGDHRGQHLELLSFAAEGHVPEPLPELRPASMHEPKVSLLAA